MKFRGDNSSRTEFNIRHCNGLAVSLASGDYDTTINSFDSKGSMMDREFIVSHKFYESIPEPLEKELVHSRNQFFDEYGIGYYLVLEGQLVHCNSVREISLSNGMVSCRTSMFGFVRGLFNAMDFAEALRSIEDFGCYYLDPNEAEKAMKKEA